jgi:hypothetical protein
VAVLVGVCGVVLGAVTGGTVDEGTADVALGTAPVGTVSTAAGAVVVVVSIVFERASLAGAELPPQPAATPLPAPSARTASTAARRGVEMEEVDGIALYG